MVGSAAASHTSFRVAALLPKEIHMATPNTHSSFRLSTDAWAILIAAALGLIIRFGLLRAIAW